MCQPPVDAFDPFFVLDPDDFFFAGSGGGLRGAGRRLLAGSNSGPGSLLASSEEDQAMLLRACLPFVVGVLAAIVCKKLDNKSRRANAHTRESSTMRDEDDDEWLVFRD